MSGHVRFLYAIFIMPKVKLQLQSINSFALVAVRCHSLAVKLGSYGIARRVALKWERPAKTVTGTFFQIGGNVAPPSWVRGLKSLMAGDNITYPIRNGLGVRRI